ncbi:gp31 head assembly cochaperone with GroEL [Aeromonas phage 65]|uniref:Head assembly chaperone protein n=2 Tax=Ishigurovirus osborne TaxID=260149 RepID=A0A219YCM1_9CAUD|nr:head morphogenesis [Aeromonas phage 65]ADQ53407.1 gp31 head assembly cochaperone with GroEL [Aeromonas phage 65]APU01764.1 head assembly chaperone protein [Aeromonas phage 65.2]
MKDIDQSKLGFKAMGDHVILMCEAKRAGEEEKSRSGIILETATQSKQGGIPTHGVIVSVGGNCPQDFNDMIGYEVALPSTGNFTKFWDPRVVRQELKENSGKDTIYVTCHHLAIRGVYTHTDKQ